MVDEMKKHWSEYLMEAAEPAHLAPRDGRAAPETRANDVLCRQTRIFSGDLAAASAALHAAHAEWISPGIVEEPRGELGFRKGLVLRDPDGHALQLTER